MLLRAPADRTQPSLLDTAHHQPLVPGRTRDGESGRMFEYFPTNYIWSLGVAATLNTGARSTRLTVRAGRAGRRCSRHDLDAQSADGH
jgi:hypothetical protein